MTKLYEAQQVVDRIAAFHTHYLARAKLLNNNSSTFSTRNVDGAATTTTGVGCSGATSGGNSQRGGVSIPHLITTTATVNIG